MIKLLDDYYLDADDDSFKLLEWKGKSDKRGVNIYGTKKYYTSLDGVYQGLKKILQRKAIQECTETDQLMQKINEANSRAYAAMKDILP